MTVQQNLQQTMTQCAAYDGQAAKVFTLKNANGTSIAVMDIGATWLSFTTVVDGTSREVLLGVDTMDQHIDQKSYLGTTVGRFANRINKGQFEIDGKTYQATINDNDNSLHGGVEGFDKRRWLVKQNDEQQITFALCSEDGDQGYPGQLDVTVTYALSDDDAVSIEYKAKVDKTCPINLTNHAYFNLDGADAGQECLSHRLEVNADQYLPINEIGIPFGPFEDVTGTSFDFRTMKTLEQDFMSEEQQKQVNGYDHSYILNEAAYKDGAVAAKLESSDGKLSMEVLTNKPGLQLYTGNFLAGTPCRSGEYTNFAGVALETQFLPNSPNHKEWDQPSCFIKADETYDFTTVYRLVKA